MRLNRRNIFVRAALPFITMVVLSVMTACKMGPNDYSEYHTLGEDGWRYGEFLRYEFIPQDSIVTGDLALSLRHTNDYIYSNIYLEVTIADSLSTSRDTLAITLADDFGRWKGRGIGTDFQVSDTIAKRVAYRRPVEISVRHIMRDEVLENIEQVGVSFTER